MAAAQWGHLVPLAESGRGGRAARGLLYWVVAEPGNATALSLLLQTLLMGFDSLEIRYIRLAHERGLGVGDVREIELVGDDVSGESWGFQVGYNSHRFLAWLAWYGPTKVFQKLVPRTPLVALPILIGEIEQDYLYWPLKYKAVAKRWRTGTAWGQLFQRYQRQGHLAD